MWVNMMGEQKKFAGDGSVKNLQKEQSSARRNQNEKKKKLYRWLESSFCSFLPLIIFFTVLQLLLFAGFFFFL